MECFDSVTVPSQPMSMNGKKENSTNNTTNHKKSLPSDIDKKTEAYNEIHNKNFPSHNDVDDKYDYREYPLNLVMPAKLKKKGK